jgi:tetratricopeptide (TPR) repeat protein
MLDKFKIYCFILLFYIISFSNILANTNEINNTTHMHQSAQFYFNSGYEKFKQEKYSLAISDLDMALELDTENGIISYYSKVLRRIARNHLIKKHSETIDDFIKDIELAQLLLLNPNKNINNANTKNQITRTYIEEKTTEEELNKNKTNTLIDILTKEKAPELSMSQKQERYDNLSKEIDNTLKNNTLSNKQKALYAILYLDEKIALLQQASDYLQRGQFNSDIQNYEQAISDFNKCITLDPKNITAYYSRALVHGTLNNYVLAINDLVNVVYFQPNNAKAYYQKGIFEYKNNNINQALEDLSKSGELGETLAYEKIIEINKKY